MRVLQLIDSLETGGAERVAVNIANTLSHSIDASFLCATRKEGLLKDSLNQDVGYLFLDKKSTVGLKAIVKLSKFVKKQDVNIIHAHSTSFFLATIIKLLNRRVRVIWHDHYGNSEFLHKRKAKILKHFSKYFSHVLSVNKALEQWAKENLKLKQVHYFPNFAIQDHIKPQTKLLGTPGKRIVHLANVRPQKDHETLIEAFKDVILTNPDWTLHCIGKDFGDEHSTLIKRKIQSLSNNVFFYGSKSDITNILNQSSIAVLSSKSEGLPLALLEYGLAGLPTIATNVGDCSEVISNADQGILVPAENPKKITAAINNYINNLQESSLKGENLKVKVLKKFSKEALIKDLLNIYNLKV